MFDVGPAPAKCFVNGSHFISSFLWLISFWWHSSTLGIKQQCSGAWKRRPLEDSTSNSVAEHIPFFEFFTIFSSFQVNLKKTVSCMLAELASNSSFQGDCKWMYLCMLICLNFGRIPQGFFRRNRTQWKGFFFLSFFFR